MAITLAAVPEGSMFMQALILALVGLGITVAVYGVVALIVKADDVGVALAQNEQGSAIGRLSRAHGRALVLGIPVVLTLLSVVGTAAMIWVGGGIVVHGLETFGLPSLSWVIHTAAEAAARALPSGAGAVEWTVTAAASGLVGLLIGAAAIPVMGFVFAPAWDLMKRTLRGQKLTK